MNEDKNFIQGPLTTVTLPVVDIIEKCENMSFHMNMIGHKRRHDNSKRIKNDLYTM